MSLWDVPDLESLAYHFGDVRAAAVVIGGEVVWQDRDANADAIKIGTSGWKFDDWAGSFYPLRVPQTKWLEYYAARFPIGEINSTYYRIAPQAAFAGDRRTDAASFQLFAKVHADVTHAREHPGDSLRALLAALLPLKDAGKLLGLLAQFPNRFQYYARERWRICCTCAICCAGERLCVEFRHRSWLEDEPLAAVRESGLTWVCPDEPELPDLMPRRFLATSDMSVRAAARAQRRRVVRPQRR